MGRAVGSNVLVLALSGLVNVGSRSCCHRTDATTIYMLFQIYLQSDLPLQRSM